MPQVSWDQLGPSNQLAPEHHLERWAWEDRVEIDRDLLDPNSLDPEDLHAVAARAHFQKPAHFNPKEVTQLEAGTMQHSWRVKQPNRAPPRT